MTKLNIVIIMVDQLNAILFPDGSAKWLHAPHLKKSTQRYMRNHMDLNTLEEKQRFPRDE